MRGKPSVFLRSGLIGAVLASLAGCAYEPHVEPLEIPPPPGTAFSETIPLAGTALLASPPGPTPSSTEEAFTSADAIELCQSMELFGDEQVGSCLAPGGDSYYVWISPGEVMLVSREDPNVQAFRLATLNRQSRLSKIGDLAAQWPELAVLFFEVFAAGISCGGAAGATVSGVGIPAVGALVLGCAGSVVGAAYTADEITRDAEELANAIVAWWQYQSDAAYNFCRMAGGSDAECRDHEG